MCNNNNNNNNNKHFLKLIFLPTTTTNGNIDGQAVINTRNINKFIVSGPTNGQWAVFLVYKVESEKQFLRNMGW